jgi:hypothetical protein
MDMKISSPAAAGTFTPTKIGMIKQDPSVSDVPMEIVTLGVSRGDKPATKDYAVTDSVKANADGNYVLDPKTDPTGFASVNVLANLQTGLDAFLPYCDADKTPASWWTLGPKQLNIYAFDRKDEPNAFFNPMPFVDHGHIVKAGTHFGVFQDPVTKETVYAAHSGEVTGHEGGPGHAVLHRFRPNYMRSANSEVRAYHEAFGDVSAMLTQLKNPAVLDAVARQTGGDLSKHNAISDLGEQFGVAINNFVIAQGGPKDYTGGAFVRTAINDLKWADPSTLPDRPDPKHPEQLSSEAHDFSRLWTGAVYSILGQAVKDRMANGEEAKSALANANEDLLKIYGKLTSNTSPEGDFGFADMARAMVKADSLVGTKLGPIINAEMTRREILPQSLGLRDDEDLTLPAGSYDVNFSFSGKEDAFKGTQLENLGGFTMTAPQSGQPVRGLLEDDHSEARSSLAGDIARLARQGKVLFTTPDQKPADIGMFDQDNEPYAAQVTWVNGQARIEPVMIMG